MPWFNEFDTAFDKMFAMARTRIDNAKKEMSKDSTWRDKPEQDMSVLEKLIAKSEGGDETVPVVMAIDGISAGIDTTGNTAGFLLYQLASNPEKQEILYQELVNVLGKDCKNKR